MSPAKNEAPLTVLSTFTGLGGFDLGLEAAGFDCKGAVEWNGDAVRSLKANRAGVWDCLEPSDIDLFSRETAPADLGLTKGELTILSGAPPCQPFSKAGQWSENGRRGMADPRSKYLASYLTVLEKFEPQIAFIENVAGFVQGQHSVTPILDSWLSRLNRGRANPYTLDWRILDAADYGVPQHRRRAILVIHRLNGGFEWPEPEFRDNPLTAWDALHSLEQDLTDLPSATGKWADLLPSIPEGSNYQWLTRKGGGKPLFGYRTRYWSFLLKLAKNRPSWTLQAQPGPSVGPFHWDNRPLSVAELLRLQTFPDDWQVAGDGRREKVRQIGNATPPLLGEALGLAARKSLGRESWAPTVHLPARADATPAPRKPVPPPHTYAHLLGTHADHPGEGMGPSYALKP